MNTLGYRRLTVYEKADQLVLHIYKITSSFSDHEKYGITSQIRRVDVSVVLNLLEGYSRRTKKDFARFLDIAVGSVVEVEYLISLSLRLQYLKQEDYEMLESFRSECGKLLWSYRQKLSES